MIYRLDCRIVSKKPRPGEHPAIVLRRTGYLFWVVPVWQTENVVNIQQVPQQAQPTSHQPPPTTKGK